MKSIDDWLKEAKTAYELFPSGGWLKDRGVDGWKWWKKQAELKRANLNFPIAKMADREQRAALRESKVPDDLIEWMSQFEAKVLLDQFLAEAYRFIAYEARVNEGAIGGPSTYRYASKLPKIVEE